MNPPTLSVVMPNYNHACFLPESLRAIVCQSYRPLEIIIVDDASTDNSIQIIQSFIQEDPCIRLIRNETNRGVVYNMNQLLELASGDYIYYAAADDKVLPGFFEKSMMLLAQYSQSSLCSALEIEIDAKSRSKGWIATPVVSKQARFFSPQECHRLFQKYGIWILSPTTIYNRQALLQAGGYIPELGSICDAFVALMMANRYGVCFIPETLACFRVSNTNTSIAEYRDPNYFVKSIKYSSQLMQTTYSDLFSADHVHIWEKQWLYTLAISKLNVLGSDHRWDFALRTLSESIPIPAWINTLLSRVMQRSIQMSHSLLRFYAAARVGWLPIALRRRFSGIGLTFEENCH